MPKKHAAKRSSSKRAVAAKRHAILQGAKAVFLKDGFGSASMDDIAALTGISKMTVYRHFGSKEDLFAGVIGDLCAQLSDHAIEVMFEDEPLNALRAFAHKMIAILYAPETVGLHRIVIAESRRFPKLGRLFYASGPEASISVLAAYLARNRKRNGFRVREPRRAAEEFLEILRGYPHLRALLGLQKRPSPREMAERVDSAIRHVLLDTGR